MTESVMNVQCTRFKSTRQASRLQACIDSMIVKDPKGHQPGQGGLPSQSFSWGQAEMQGRGPVGLAVLVTAPGLAVQETPLRCE